MSSVIDPLVGHSSVILLMNQNQIKYLYKTILKKKHSYKRSTHPGPDTYWLCFKLFSEPKVTVNDGLTYGVLELAFLD